MTTLPIASDLDALTPEWLTAALADVLGGATVVAVDAQWVGTGQMARSVRLRLTLDREVEGAPASVVAKLPAGDDKTRATSAALRNYEIETSFYRELAPILPVRAPRCYHVAHDPVADEFVLVLEDLAPAEQGDQLVGCTVDQAATAVDELTRLHAPRWGDPALERYPWLHRSTEESAAFTAQLVAGLFEGFVARYHARIEPDVMAMGERFIPRLAEYAGGPRGPLTVTHGDYRLDNLLFATEEGGYPVAVVDWQTVSTGAGISDLSYFIGAGLVTEDRRSHEEALVRDYHRAMAAAGVDLDWDDCWAQYRRYTFAGFIMAVAASMLVEQTVRGDDMFVTMANRHGRHALDLDAEALLDA